MTDREHVKNGPWRALLDDVASIERSGMAVSVGLRCALGMLPPLIIGVATGYVGDGVSAAVGALVVGFVSFEGRYRSTLRNMILASIGVTISAFVGAVAASHLVVLLLVLAIWGFLGGLAGAFGSGISMAAMQAVEVLVVFSGLGMGIESATVQALWILGGALLQIVLLLLTWPTRRLDGETASVGEVYRRLASYARSASLTAPPADQLMSGADWLGDPNPLGDPSAIVVLKELFQLAQDIRLSLSALVFRARGKYGKDDEEAQWAIGFLGQTATLLSAIGDQLCMSTSLRAKARPWSRRHRRLLADSIDLHEPVVDESKTILGLLTRQLKRALSLTEEVMSTSSHVVLPGLNRSEGSLDETVRRRLSGFRKILATDTELLFHAGRLVLVLVTGTYLAHILALPNGYWVPMTAAVVLQGDFSGTVQRGLARLGGTLIGAVAVTELAALVVPARGVLIAVIVLLTWCTYATYRANYFLYSIFLTSDVVVMFTMIGSPVGTTAQERAVATALGGAIAITVFLLWPTWRRRLLPRSLAAMVRTQGAYAAAVLRSFDVSLANKIEIPNGEELRVLAVSARSSRQLAATLLEGMSTEPGTEQAAVAAAGAILGQVNFCALLALALNAELLQDHQFLDGMVELGAAVAELSSYQADRLESFGSLNNPQDTPDFPTIPFDSVASIELYRQILELVTTFQELSELIEQYGSVV
ncbi:MAG: FUSC family protein [Ferrimicrobium sp.]